MKRTDPSASRKLAPPEWLLPKLMSLKLSDPLYPTAFNPDRRFRVQADDVREMHKVVGELF